MSPAGRWVYFMVRTLREYLNTGTNYKNIKKFFISLCAFGYIFILYHQTQALPLGNEQEYVSSKEDAVKVDTTSPEALKSLIRNEFENDEVMLKIAHCESGTRHFDKQGNVIRSHTNDVGLMQINVPTWESKAKDMGIDIYTAEGNVKMAKHILEVQGLDAWVCYQKMKKI